jgi:hypothetical protein
MKDLIKKILRESTEELLKYRKLFNDFEIPDEGIKGSTNQDGSTNIDDFFWKIVDMVDYKSDNDYKRISTTLLNLNRFGGIPAEKILALAKVLNYKCRALEKKWGDDIRGVGDDSWSDLRCDIVSRGKEFYDRALSDFDLVQRMSNEDDYTESFSYAIPFTSDLI